jgi:chromosome transmission fidelity protein 1
LIRYLSESKLARKVESYATHTEIEASKTQVSSATKKSETTSTPVLHQISSLLSALTNPSKEGRLFFTKLPPDNISLSYLLLDPSTSFSEIVSECRSVILAGGTMSPFAPYFTTLFPSLPPSQITTLSCRHVIPSSNLLAWTLSRGPSNQEFNFTFSNRTNTTMIDELGRALLNICTIVPDGVVVFFPSYAYLTTILARWGLSPSPSQPSILSRLESKKSLFKESKEASSETVLQEYAQAIDSGKGGLLLSVVGGKMSEGINFSDALGRCVLIVGLPYPNIASVSIQAKMEYIESSTRERLGREGMAKVEAEKKAKEEAREWYENACMRAVNQSIGRAIRHKADYAAVVMVDGRFSGERVKGKLPGWIREGLVEGAGEKKFGELMGGLGAFFRGKKAG